MSSGEYEFKTGYQYSSSVVYLNFFSELLEFLYYSKGQIFDEFRKYILAKFMSNSYKLFIIIPH